MHTLLASRPNVVASMRVDATRRARCERALRNNGLNVGMKLTSVFLCRLDERDTLSMIAEKVCKRPSEPAPGNETNGRSPAADDTGCDELRKKARYRYQFSVSALLCVFYILSLY